MRELRQLRAVQGVRPVRYLGGRFLDLLRQFRPRRDDPLVLLTPAFRSNGSALHTFGFGCAWPDQRRQQASEIRFLLRAHADWWARTREERIRFTHPWLDKRVLEFCLAAPAHLKMRNGYQRYLIRAALDGVLPKRIQWRTTKAPFSPDYNARYNAQLGKAREFVAAIGAKDPVRAAIDVAQLKRLLNPVDLRATSTIARDLVPASIYAICFLRQFSEFRL
jgi:asparagine synthase (glutamine-hydrolysing)